jgi:uncharacterized damage-inducible protein DinB
MKILLSILLLSFFFIGVAQSNQVLINSHIEKFKNAKSYTLSMADKLVEEKYDFKPVKEAMSFKEQLVHIGENIYWLSSTYLKESPNPIKDKKVNSNDMNKEQVMQFVRDAYEYGLNTMREMDEKALTNEFNWNGGKLNKYQFLNLIQDHQTHHVGQLIVYLRLNAIEPPRYIGW